MNAAPHTMGEACARFCEFERALGLFGREVDGVRYWHLMRFHVYSTFVLPNFVKMGAMHPDMQRKPPASAKPGFARRVAGKLRGKLKRLGCLVFRNPSFAVRRRDVLVSITPRVVRLEDGRRVRLAIDFFLGRLNSSWAVLERPLPGTGYAAHDAGGRTFTWHAASEAAKAYRRSQEFLCMATEMDAAAQQLAKELSERLGVTADAAAVREQIAAVVSLERAAAPVIRSWLARLRVKCVIVVVHYSTANLLLSRVAKEMGIPVVELQHGMLGNSHVAYNLPQSESGSIPDLLFTWGDFWSAQAKGFPCAGKVETGYPYLEHFYRKSGGRRSERSRKTVLFLSQGPVGAELSKMAVDLRKSLPQDRFEVTFKPHPNERKSWRTLYPWLDGSGVTVEDDAACSVYDCFGRSDVSVGAYSTALVEGAMWGVPAYVVKSLPGADLMEPFLGTGMVSLVEDAADLSSRLLAGTGCADAGEGRPELWRLDAAENIARAIDRIASAPNPSSLRSGAVPPSTQNQPPANNQ